MSIDRPPRRCRGMTFIELIMFIVIVSVGLAGLLSALNVSVRSSADPMIRKQMLSIAEALLEEVELQPFTYCDPTDATWSTATSATTGSPPTTCTATVQGLAATGGQTRISAATPFNNVGDYAGASGDGGGATGLGDATHPIMDPSGTVPALTGYTASIAVAPAALGGIGSAACASPSDCSGLNAVLITVTVSRIGGGDSLTVEGYRTRYWPNDQPW